MSFLMQFFASNTKLAEELAQEEPLLQQSLARYFSSFNEKQAALSELMTGKSMAEVLPQFSFALADEIALVAGSEKTERQIIDELRAFHYERHIEEFKHIKETMNYATSQDRYIYHLMKQLYKILTEEAHILHALKEHPDSQQLRDAFFKQLEAEKLHAEELKKIDNLSSFYKNLALGERKRHELEAEEEEFAETLYQEMLDHEVIDGIMHPMNDHAITKLTADCFNKLEEEVDRAVENKELQDHPRAIFEFVNSTLFEEFVHNEINKKNLDIGKDTERIFIILFREFYNNKESE